MSRYSKVKRKQRTSTVVMNSISDMLFTMAGVVALYIVYLVWWTGVMAEWDQQKLLADFSMVQPPDAIAPHETDNPPCAVSPKNERDMIGRVYIPQFGSDYVRNLVQGTDRYKVLDLQGYGHYDNTVMPGCIGNFAAAAHRGGYGESLARVEELKVGDPLIIRDRENWYVYKMTSHEIVQPAEGQVIFPIPSVFGSYVASDAEEKAKLPEVYNPKDPLAARERLLTFTTCHPRWGSETRYIVHAKLDYWAKVENGIPQELADIGFKLKK